VDREPLVQRRVAIACERLEPVHKVHVFRVRREVERVPRELRRAYMHLGVGREEV
jgi:hypothetical protein